MSDPVAPVAEEPKTTSFLEMSDADMLNAKPPTLESRAKPAEVVEPVAETTLAKESSEEVVDEADGDKPNAKETADEAVVEDKTPTKPAATKAAPADTKPAETAAEAKPKETPAIDYEAEYKRLLAPFKANGREIQVSSVEDAVALMQMGANYNKKMAALKPGLKLLKTLENHGLMSEEKIGFLIDLSKKNPGAINKLVKESGLDPMDLDAEKASAYKQSTYAVDDREMELDSVLDELQDSPTYTQTLDVVSNKWDVASKQVVSQTPQLLKVINDHMASGIYGLISTEMERERMLGRLKGMSDIEAYRAVGDAIQARGGFNQLVKSPKVDPATQREVVTPKPKAADNDALNEKRRAASSTKSAAPSAPAQDFNPLAMSDAEFSKLSKPKFA
jgi:hypothetical protein